MPPPVAAYVVAVIASVAAAYVFKEFVYEPHIAPTLESWAESFLERRRNARNRRATAVHVPSSRLDRRNSCSSTSPSNDAAPTMRGRGRNGREGAPAQDDLSSEAYELEGLVAREVDEWRNEVLRSQGIAGEGLRRRNIDRPRDGFDSFDDMSTSFDESFTSLTRTPLAPTHVISNVSSPTTVGTMSLPLTPTRRLRSESQSTTTQGNVDTLFVVLSSPPLPPVTSPRAGSKTLSSAEVTSYSPSHAGSSSTDTPTCPSSPAPLTIPPISRQDGPANSSPFTLTVRNASSPLPFTPTYQTTVDDSPFGPLIPDTPRSSAEMYGERPFSPIARVMGPSSAPGSVGSSATLSSRTNSMTSMRTVGSAGTLRRGSRLANEVVMDSPDDHGDDEEDNQRTSPFNLMSTGIHVNESVVSSLSERYPAPSTPPVVISPPASSVGIISAPSSPRSGGSEVVIDNDVVLVTEPHTRLQPQTLPPLSMLQVPSGARRSTSRSRSPGPSATSPTLSFASFLSPMSVSQSVPESERDEFMSIADGFSDWSASPVMPSANGQRGPLHDRAYNPFLDFEEVMSDGDGSDDGGSEHRNGSDGSDESWGSARRHQGEV